MTYDEIERLIHRLSERWRRAGMTRAWWEWTTAEPITWEKVFKWAEKLGVK